MVTISGEDAQQLIQRLTNCEERIGKLGEVVEAQHAELVAQNERNSSLCQELRTLSEGQQVELRRLRDAHAEMRAQLAEIAAANERLQAGGGGAAGAAAQPSGSSSGGRGSCCDIP